MDYADMPEELLLGETANYLNFICTDAKGLRQMNDFFKGMFQCEMIRIPTQKGTRGEFRRQLMNDAFRLAILIRNSPCDAHHLLPCLLEADGVAHEDDPRVPVVFVLAMGFLYSNPERPFRLRRLFLEFCHCKRLDPKPMGARWVIRMVNRGPFYADFSFHPAPVDEMKPSTKQWLANHLRPDDLLTVLRGYTTMAHQLEFLDFALGHCHRLMKAAETGGLLWQKGIGTLRQEIEMGCLLEGKQVPDNQLLDLHRQQQRLTAELEAARRQLDDRQRQIEQDKLEISRLSALSEGYEKDINDFYESFVGWKSSFWRHGDSNPELLPAEKLGHLLPGLNAMVELADTMHPYLDGQTRISTDDIVRYCGSQNLSKHQVNALVCMLRHFGCKMKLEEDRKKLEEQCRMIEEAWANRSQRYPPVAHQTTINNHFTSDQLQYVNQGGKGKQLNLETAPARPATTSGQGKNKKRPRRNGPSDSRRQGNGRGRDQ